jgi:hypothetical protein
MIIILLYSSNYSPDSPPDYPFLLAEVGKQTFFSIPQIANSWAHSAIEICNFLRYASLQIANLKIFMINSQIETHKFLQNTAQKILSENSPKRRFFT